MLRVGYGISGTNILSIGRGVSVGGGGGPSGPTPWVTVWQTTTPGETITLPFVSAGTYDVHVDWGDGSTDNITAYNDPAVTHAFATPGTQTIAITGVMTHWSFANAGDKDKITAVTQAGTTGETLTNLSGGFHGCTNLASLPNTAWTKNVTDMTRALAGISTFNVDIGGWDVSGVKNFSAMFQNSAAFNRDISAWDVSSAQDMRDMFRATSFNQDISGWDVSNVAFMLRMFRQSPFNQDISGWDVSSVVNMQDMFYLNSAFNQDISGWDVSNVTNMQSLFNGASSFNQDISGWNVSSVVNMVQMFSGSAFDQDISGWDVSNVTNMHLMFSGVTLSTANYDALLIGWSQRTLQNNVQFDGGNSQYSAAAAAARQHIVDTYGWTITDGGLAA